MGLSQRKRKLVARLRSRRTRGREGLFLVEGVRGAEEAMDAGVQVRFAVVSDGLSTGERGGALAGRLEGSGVAVERVDAPELASISDTETPQGVLLVCVEPAWSLDALDPGSGGRLLVLDAVQDPGNLGTLVRAARAFALDGVLALDGTVDPWNPKSVRAAAGAGFGLPILRASWDEVEPWLEARDVRLLAADAAGMDVAHVSVEAPWALAVGNEGQGVRAGVLRLADARVAVPMPGGTESLNAGVAGSILLYSLTRR